MNSTSLGDRFDSTVVARLQAMFERSRDPMLFADDRRLWVTANPAACELLGHPREEVLSRSIDNFMPPSARAGLDERWRHFLNDGSAEGQCELKVPGRPVMTVEFGATANVLPARHLFVVAPRDPTLAEEPRGLFARREAAQPSLATDGDGRLPLTPRERDVMTLAASGLLTADIAVRLFVSPETVKTHIQNAMGKLGAHTRAHAVAIALVTDQIAWPA